MRFRASGPGRLFLSNIIQSNRNKNYTKHMANYRPSFLESMVDDATYPQSAGDISTGDYIVIDKRPCKVLSIYTYESTSNDNMCAFVATDIFNGAVLNYVAPASHQCDVPRVNITEYKVTGIDENGSLKLSNMYREAARADLKLPTDNTVRLLKFAFSKNHPLAVRVMSAMGEEQICGASYY